MADRIKISRRKEYRENLRLYLNLTVSLNAKLKKLFKRTAIQVSNQYKENQNSFFNLDQFSNELYKILSSHYRTVITLMKTRLEKLRRKQDIAFDGIIRSYIARNTAEKVQEIDNTTKKQIKKTIEIATIGEIVNGILESPSVNEVAKKLKNSTAFSTARATLIARTETHSAMNYGSYETAKQLDLKQPMKEWMAINDKRTRSWHSNMNKKMTRRGDDFIVETPNFGYVNMSFTGDPKGGASNVINCRCFTLYFDLEDRIVD